jgi:hypothetical protein
VQRRLVRSSVGRTHDQPFPLPTDPQTFSLSAGCHSLVTIGVLVAFVILVMWVSAVGQMIGNSARHLGSRYSDFYHLQLFWCSPRSLLSPVSPAIVSGSANGARYKRAILEHVFLMTGAQPHTRWLQGCVVLDDHGFVKTGPDLGKEQLAAAHWNLPRPPYLLESSVPGVFAAGDVRAGSVKRIASAVGDGSICVQFVHRVLREFAEAGTRPTIVAA